MKFINKELNKFIDEEEFDIFCKDLFRAILKDDSTRRYGRKGQKQFGIDIHSPKSKKGIQSKVRDNSKKSILTTDDIDKDLEKAQTIPLDINTLVFATTSIRDTEIQNHVDSLNQSLTGANKIQFVEVYFWEDLLEELEDCKEIYLKYFSDDEQNSWHHTKNSIDNAYKLLKEFSIDAATKIADDLLTKLKNDELKFFHHDIYKLNADLFSAKNAFLDIERDQRKAGGLYLEASKHSSDDYIDALNSKAHGCLLLGDIENCKKYTEECFKLDTENEETISLVIATCTNNEELLYFTNKLNFHSKSKTNYFKSLANFYLRIKDSKQAQKFYEIVIERDPDDNQSKFNHHELVLLVLNEKLLNSHSLKDEDLKLVNKILEDINSVWLKIKKTELAKYRSVYLKIKFDCLSILGRGKEALEICKEALQIIFSTNSFNYSLFNFQASLICLKLKLYFEANDFIKNCNSNHIHKQKLVYAITLFHIGEFNEAGNLLEELKSDSELAQLSIKTLDDLFSVQNILETAYILKMTTNEQKYHAILCRVALQEDIGLRYERHIHENVKEVDEGLAVTLDADGHEETFILDSNERITNEKVLKPSDRLYKELKGKKVGQEIVLDPHRDPPEIGIIKNIISKYAVAADFIGYSRKYPGQPIGFRQKVDKLESLQDLEKIIERAVKKIKEFGPDS